MGNARSAFDYLQNGLRRFSAATPHRTVRAVFPHTALRVGLVSSVSLPFAPRLRFTLIPMDAPPYGRAVSDAPPHRGLSPIAVFRHYCSRHLICIVPFTRRGPSHPRALPRVQNRFGRTASASQRLNCWPRGTQVTRLYEEGSFALRLTSLSGRTPAFGSRTRLRALRVAFGEVPSKRRSPFCGASSYGLLGPSGYPLASLGPHCVRRVCPNHISVCL